MSEEIRIDQRPSFGSNTSQIGVQNNYYHQGLTASDALGMAFDLFRQYFPQLREEALADVRKSVNSYLQTIPSQNLVPASPRIVIPTLQNASITEEPEIRKMYANLLSKSMVDVLKDGIHPSFVEIIKQLSCDEAKVVQYMFGHPVIPTITVRYENEKGEGYNVLNKFSNIGELSGCEYPYECSKYFDNLTRLGLMQDAASLSSLTHKELYEPLKTHKYIQPYVTQADKQTNGYNKLKFNESYISLTDFGKSFCMACLDSSTLVFVE